MKYMSVSSLFGVLNNVRCAKVVTLVCCAIIARQCDCVILLCVDLMLLECCICVSV